MYFSREKFSSATARTTRLPLEILAIAILLVGYIFPLLADTIGSAEFLKRLQLKYGDAAFSRGQDLRSLLTALSTASEREQLDGVNAFFNRFSYIADQDQWHQPDYWATPEEFLGTHQGDCEDYVIAKYFALRELGIDEEKLYLTYVKAREFNAAHMVLTYFEDAGSVPLVLDNYDLRILPASERSDLLPVYSFNARQFFLTDTSAGLGTRLPSDRVKNDNWTEILSSMREGATR